jgi:hypothetical protein
MLVMMFRTCLATKWRFVIDGKVEVVVALVQKRRFAQVERQNAVRRSHGRRAFVTFRRKLSVHQVSIERDG